MKRRPSKRGTEGEHEKLTVDDELLDELAARLAVRLRNLLVRDASLREADRPVDADEAAEPAPGAKIIARLREQRRD